ncbi:hypothetical protein Acsp04_66540 [Actinomadura sp. NBRC 104425]|uniref:hypothetical protein n=1 Tax=Actinomadura sp. NBRC 104425 TaxID=3032204 RepID=UPI0024A174D7|nr:hypothetical protein [Actinomadura sp. NBRC 104425]GLZ16419.1 hypothetical protein Acsp04_66540 [Actinomadura sp. NBRC 104425]
MDTTTLRAAARYFPLLGRPRPACPPLASRVQEIADIADTAYRVQQQGGDALHDAAHALNKAALLASDCGLTDEARRLCWRHIDLYCEAGPQLTAVQARYMLEPVVNLARLHIRNNELRTALHILEAMHHATTRGTDLTVDDRLLPLAQLTGTLQERNKLREWVWLQLLTDGIRALTRDERWNDAVALAEVHRGIGTHLMEGRQVAILAACLDGTTDAARDLLHTSTLTQPWEHQVASCLEVMCGGSDKPDHHRTITTMIQSFRNSRPAAGYAVFRARFGLTTAILARSHSLELAAAVLAQAADEAIAARDGYAAREVLNHRVPHTGLTDQQHRALDGLIAASGLGAGPLPPMLQDAFTDAISIAVTALTVSLKKSSASSRRG